MVKVIKIFDPKEKPFGWLSNNYRHFMRIDGKEWQYVTSYIYANILKIPMSVQIIRLTRNVKDIKNEFTRLYQDEVDSVTKKAMETSLKVKFENKKLSEMLVSTGDAPIFYVSNNKLLGVGPNNDGQNVYGKYLMQTRHLLRVAFKYKKEEIAKAEKDQLIFDVYLAQKGLVEQIREGKDIKQFLNKTPAEIVDNLGREKLMNIAPERDFILENVHKGYFKDIVLAIEYPESLVIEIRRKHMKGLRIVKLKERKGILFDMYADYLLEKHYPDLDADKYSTAKEQQFKNMGWQQKNDLEDRLYELFHEGMLSSRLSDAFENRMADFHIPSEEEVIEAENVAVKYTDKPVVVEAPYVPAKGAPILVFPADSSQVEDKFKPYLQFSPISFTGMLTIEGRSYPTVTHFIIASLMAYIPGIGGLHRAYPYLLADPKAPVVGPDSFLHMDVVQLKYNQMRDRSYHDQLRKNAITALNTKFENRVLQDILLMTGDEKLVWNDSYDPILGVGQKEFKGGKNFVGEYLMKLRTKFTEERKGETMEKLHTGHITLILNEDPFMYEWLYMRVADMCKVLRIMKNYLWTKKNIDSKYNPEFITAVIDKVYQPCSHIFGSVNKITAEVPRYFRYMVQKQSGFSQIGHESVEVMWKRVAVMMYYLIKHIEQSTIQNLRAVLGRIELMVTKGAQCIDIIPNNRYDNCIVSALINLLKGIVEFNKQTAYNTEITEIDVNTAVSIILNTNISEEVKPVEPVETEVSDQEDGVLIPEGGGEEDNFIFPGDEESGEIDYGDITEDRDDVFSPRRNMLVSVLSEMDEVKDTKKIALYIESAIETVKTYPISKQVKRNRINFFATQR